MKKKIKADAWDEGIDVVGNNVYKYSGTWTHKLESRMLWHNYWWQQKLMENIIKKDEHLLEIGVGTGFAANYLKSKGFNITTLDIDPSKKPDIVANIATYNFDRNYDHILCFEVLEHLPFSDFKTVLLNIHMHCRGFLFMSIPRNEYIFFSIDIKLKRFRKTFTWRMLHKKILSHYHQWEVDYGGITISKVESVILDAGYEIVKREKHDNKLFYILGSSEK